MVDKLSLVLALIIVVEAEFEQVLPKINMVKKPTSGLANRIVEKFPWSSRGLSRSQWPIRDALQ
ncbi:MAG: hypothetical protein WBM84_15580 [Sedimenticolaceae bacterium]